jgi:hypothetical protein
VVITPGLRILTAGALVLAAAACQKAPEGETADTAAAASAEPGPPRLAIEGDYVGEGVEPDGTPYECTVQVDLAKQVFNVLRQVDDAVPHDGVGLRRGDILIVGFRDDKLRYGLLVYTINDDGSLAGVLAYDGGTTTGTETLRKAP